MPIALHRVFVPRERGLAVEVSRADAVEADEIAFLERVAPPDGILAEHYVLLRRQRWAIGRTGADGTVWRVGDLLARERLFHPAWLWRDDDAFAREGDDTTHVAPALPLRLLIRDAMPLFGSVFTTCQCIAGTIAALRRRRRPVAVHPLEHTDPAVAAVAARHFGLAILTALPVAWRRRLRVSTRQPVPDAGAWDLVVTPGDAHGFTSIHAEVPPDVEEDLVAAYLFDRLIHKDPEAVEAAAYMSSGSGGRPGTPEPRPGSGDDPWGDGVRAHLAGGVPGVSAVGEKQLDIDPQGAVRAVCRRITSGAAIRGQALHDLAAVTARTGDPRPWRLVAAREPGERARVVLSTLPHLEPAAMTEALARAITHACVGSAVGPWAAFLVQVLGAAQESSFALELLSDLVGGRNSPLDAATRTSLWQEVTTVLVERHEASAAAEGLLSAAGRRIAAEGGAASMVHGFLALPTASRTAGALRAVVDAIARSPHADRSMALLWRGLPTGVAAEDEDGPTPQHIVLQQWARYRTGLEAPELPDDAFLALLQHGPFATTWGEIVAPLASPQALPGLLRPVAPSDPELAPSFWGAVELARAVALGSDARTRLADLGTFVADAGPSVEPLARELLREAFLDIEFPAPDLCGVASDLAEVEDVSSLWMWLAVAAQEPGSFTDDTIDATVVAFCDDPPSTEDDRLMCQQIAEALAASPAWNYYELARWIARLVMAPDGDDTGFGIAIANQILRAVARRPDGLTLVTQMTREFLKLSPDHVGLRIFLARLLPHAWNGGPPPAYIEAIRTTRMGLGVRALWHEALGLEDD